jgi:Na+-driven multidrug efflux pump
MHRPDSPAPDTAPAAVPDSAQRAVSRLLTAPVLPTLLRASLPNLVALLATAGAAIAETVYVGRLGVEALAGMALVFPMVMLQQMFSSGAMGGGVSSAISRALGSGDTPRAQALAWHALWIGLCGGLLYMALMLVGGPALFRLLGGMGLPLARAVEYAQVAFLGSVFVWLLNTLASILRGTGNMTVPSTVNFFVAGLQVVAGGVLGLGAGSFAGLGMRGVAAGQVVAYGVGVLALGGYVLSGRARLQLRPVPLQWPLLRDILRVGALACISPLQTVLTILLVTALVARFGPVVLAGYGIGTRLEFLLVPIAFAVGVASAPMIGMAIGAGHVARARRVAWTGATLVMGGMGLLGLALAVYPAMWTHHFSNVPAVLDAAALYFAWAGPCYGLFGFGLCLYFSSMGAGKVGGPVLAGTLRLVWVAVGGAWLGHTQAPVWAVFALVTSAMAAYGLATAWAVKVTPWGPAPAPATKA